MSAIEWLDYSSSERDRVMDALAEPKEKGTLDELGFGSVRDAIADHLFPAINTLQTRAKYGLFVAWIYKALLEGQVPSQRLKDEGVIREKKLIHALLAGEGMDADGLIGKESMDALKRMPSAFYWNPLRQLEIYKGGGSLAQYLEDVDALRTSTKQRRDSSFSEDGEARSSKDQVWDPAMPQADERYLENAAFALNTEQATYLRDKVLAMPAIGRRLCLLQWLVQQPEISQDLDSMVFPWEMLDAFGKKMPKTLFDDLIHARNFAKCIQGCTTIYYRFLSEVRREPTDEHDQAISEWLVELQQLAPELLEWHGNIERFWHWIEESQPRLNRDRPFINGWLNRLAASGFNFSAVEQLIDEDLRRTIRDREYRLKGALARLSNAGPLERWQPATSAGLLSYRWRQARRFLSDIHTGLGDTTTSLTAVIVDGGEHA